MDVKLWLIALTIAAIITIREFVISVIDAKKDLEFDENNLRKH